MARDPSNDDQRNAATAIAVVGVLICGGGLLGLAAMVIPDILWVIVVIAVMVIIGIIQYALWGWRLDKYRIEDDE